MPDQTAELKAFALGAATAAAPLSPEFREEQLSRNTLFFGEEGMSKIRKSTVIVVGLGGVGSHCAHLVARSGVERLILVDFDQVTLSSTNRHATATLRDVGTPKVTAVKRFLAQVCPNCEVFDLNEMFTKDSASRLLDKFGKIDFVVDAIDDLPTKAFLIKSCVDRNIQFLSSMGAACKADPTRMHIGDIRSATKDPLSTKLRWHLRKLKVDIDNPLIKILYSSEKVTARLAPLTAEQQAEPKEFGTVDNMRLRVLPVLGTMPAIMGQAIASYVLCELGEKPFSPLSAERLGKSVRHRMLQHIKGREEKTKKEIVEGTAPEGAVSGVEVDTDDIEYMMCQVWRNRCMISGDRLGSGLELVKWDVCKPASVSNLVLMSGKGWTKFQKVGGKEGIRKEMPDVAKEIEKRLAAVVEP
ncbi:hypothetical protein TrCOL_g8919 [Triparma columacea]|uniref:THIF-type NAD/FAD binding fold domain-containing protein n=1 Tax=Triparma columacea TaxID=722753 RepID=A0A9W7GLV8_9STRA|nr:hypothetical protein TrCOL_g8919 [Triparma columacea]